MTVSLFLVLKLTLYKIYLITFFVKFFRDESSGSPDEMGVKNIWIPAQGWDDKRFVYGAGRGEGNPSPCGYSF